MNALNEYLSPNIFTRWIIWLHLWTFILSHCSKDRGNFCKWERAQSLNVAQSVIGLWSSCRPNYGDTIIKNNIEQRRFWKRRSPNHKQGNDVKINTIQNNQSWALERNIRVDRGKCLFFFFLLHSFLAQAAPAGTTTAYQMEGVSSSVWSPL